MEPYRHLLREERWYLVAYDLMREDWRIFRLDRMQDVSSSVGTHSPRTFTWRTIEDWLTSDFGATNER